MKKLCAFCSIVHKETVASVVYEDDKVIAFLSNRPINIGHTLVVPKKHYENIFEIPEKEIAYLFKIVKKVAVAVKRASGSEGLKIVQNNGEAADQVIFHIHVHIIPMNRQHSFLVDRRIRNANSLNDDAKRIQQFT